MERLPAATPVPVRRPAPRESRMGRPGHSSAYLLMAGTQGFGFRHGEVWGVHLGWSGNQNLYAERIYNGARVARRRRAARAGRGQAGARGQAYRTPWTVRQLRRGHWTRSPHGSTGTCGPGRSIRVRPGRSWSTPGRPCTSTTIAAEADAAGRPGRGGRRRAVRARRRLVPPVGATTRAASVTGPCRRTSGRRDWVRWSTTCRARHAVRAVGRAGDGQPGLRPGPRAPRVDLQRRRSSGRCAPGTSTCSTWPPRRVRARAEEPGRPAGDATTSGTSSGTTTGT